MCPSQPDDGSLPIVDYERGMRPVGTSTHAFLQPDGGWGWSNAGLIVGTREAVLVDTFFDLGYTRALLDACHQVTDLPIRTVVNTHHNGDHCWGNQLVDDATIVGHRNCRELLMAGTTPGLLSGIASAEPDDGAVGYLQGAFAPFDFSGIELVPPTVTFADSLSLYPGDKEVRLLYFGPAHTLGDVAVWVPDERVLYCGDLLFYGSTPLVWEGSLQNWIAAIDGLLALDPLTVVPGHGPITDARGLRDMQAYLQHVVSEGAKLKQDGLSPMEAALRIDLGRWKEWTDSERLALNLTRLWLELDVHPPDTPIDPFEAFAAMAELRQRWAAGEGPQA